MGILPLLVVLTIVHIALNVGDVFLANLFSDTGYYGGSSGFLPSGGDAAHPYDRFSAFVAGDSRPQLDSPGNAGGLGIFQWIVRTPLCTASSMVHFTASLAILNYDLVNAIPNAGFGWWAKVGIHAIGTLLTLLFADRLVKLLIIAGMFSNIYLLVALGLVSAVGFGATLLNALGGLTC